MNSPKLPQPAGESIHTREASERRDLTSCEPEEASPCPASSPSRLAHASQGAVSVEWTGFHTMGLSEGCSRVDSAGDLLCLPAAASWHTMRGVSCPSSRVRMRNTPTVQRIMS